MPEQLPDTVPPMPSLPTGKPRHLKRVLLILALIIVLFGGVTAYFVLTRSTPNTAKPSARSSKPANTSPTPDDTGTATPKTYVSKGSDLNLTLVYPSSWSVDPASGGNEADGVITFTSPRTSMANADDESVVARAILTVRPKGSDFTEFASGTAAAAIDSYQIAYDHPTKIQHGYPYLSFIHSVGGDNPKHQFEEVMISGATKFSKDQVISPYSLYLLDPIISVTFYECITQLCTGDGAKPLEITNDTWQSSDLGQQTLAIFKSLQLN